jgi:hypothetical protein
MVGVIDIGTIVYNKQELTNINKIVLDYGLSNINDSNIVNEMQILATYNKKNINTKIEFKDMEFVITSTYYVEGIFPNIFNTKGYKISSHYKGYLDGTKKIIKGIK